MKVLIPMQSQKGLPGKIIDAYGAQTEKAEIITIGVPCVKDDVHRFSEARSRGICSLMAKVISDTVVCMADSDCLQLFNINLAEAKAEMERCPELGAVALSKYEMGKMDSEHVDIKCIVIRTQLLSGILWLAPMNKLCLCFKVKEHLDDLDYSFRYLDNRKRITCF
jgi:hypothetical protein